MAKIRKIYDQTIKPDGSKTTIYPITSTRAVYTPEGETLDSYIKDGYFHGADLAGYKVVYELSELPLEETPFGYLMDSNLYVWVGTNGDTLDGKYQNCGPFKGPRGYDGHDGRDGRDGEPGIQGIRGPQGPAGLTGPQGAKGDKGDSGVSLGEVALTTDLDETETGKALDASAMQTIPSMVDVEEEIEEVPSNYYTRTQVDAIVDSERVARQRADLNQNSEIASFENTITNQVNSYKPIVIEGNVSNAPDEEDITSKDGLLKLKDRNNLNGKGYIILRRNKTFKEQVVNANTIYEIRYDFDLRENQEDIELISEFEHSGIIYYSNEEAIALKANQAIWVPNDCVVLNEDRDVLLSVNSSYRPSTEENVFIACTESKTISYSLDGIIEIPDGCVLRFDGGKINYGVLSINGCDVLPRFNSIISTDLFVSGMPKVGVFYFQNGIPTWSDGENWVNASGEVVDDNE